MSDHDAEFGIVQGDHFHGGDDLAGLLHLPSNNKVEVGLFHQILHVVLRLDHHQLLHTWRTQKHNAVLSALASFNYFFFFFFL